MSKLLSIITPYYNSLPELSALATNLEPQLTDEVEWIIIDDGCNETFLDSLRAKVIHLPINSGGASKPRNKGLEIAQGEYIVFVDSDDLVAIYYVQTILNKIKSSKFDYCYMSWCTDKTDVIITDEPPLWNTSVWNCVYKRDMIGDNRFDESIIIGEDHDFNNRVRAGKKENISDIMYFYRNDRDDSLTHKAGDGNLWAKI